MDVTYNWIPLNDPAKHGLMHSISQRIAEIERTRQLDLPHIGSDSEVALISDYSGEHKGARFKALSFLLANRAGILGRWEHERLRIRQQFLADGRRIAFKALHDRNRQRSLGPFLKSADSIDGLLLCVAIDNRIQSVSYPGLPSEHDIADWSRLSWDPKVFEKLIQVLHFASLLVAGICRPKQNLLWITDDDAIVANEGYQQDACRIADRMFSHYGLRDLGQLALGVAGKFDDNKRAEDLASIADLAAGAISGVLNEFESNDAFPKSSKIIEPLTKRLATKTQVLFAWLSDSTVPLKKLICVLRPADSGKLQFAFLKPHTILQPTGMWFPPDKGWQESAQYW
jgi:hypothetical protein